MVPKRLSTGKTLAEWQELIFEIADEALNEEDAAHLHDLVSFARSRTIACMSAYSPCYYGLIPISFAGFCFLCIARCFGLHALMMFTIPSGGTNEDIYQRALCRCRFMVFLAGHGGTEPVPLKEIAEATSISRKYPGANCFELGGGAAGS